MNDDQPLNHCSDRHYRLAAEGGNIFALLFGAVGIVGMIGAATMTIMSGPVKTMSDVNRRTVAETSMMAGARMAMAQAAVEVDNNGDCDSDGFIEPLPFNTQVVGRPKPSGGGIMSASIGAQKQDPWGTEFGYCAWDHGDAILDATCEDPPATPANRVAGAPGPTAGNALPVVAVISAGRDRIFQTYCYTFTEADTKAATNEFGAAGNSNGLIDLDERMLVKVSGSDDIVMMYTYSEAQGVMGGLWTVKDAETAEIASRDIEIVGDTDTGGAARIGYDAGLGLSGVGDFLAMKTDEIYAHTNPNGSYANGRVVMNSPLRAQVVAGADPPVSGGGGGGGTPSGTAGAVQFSDGTDFASDAANLFWDDAANELGIGTGNPGEKLDVWNNANSAAYAVVSGLRVTNNAGGTNYSRFYIGQASTNKMFLEAADQANTKGELLLQPWGGNVGIGNVDPTTALDVTGTVTATTFAGSGASLTSLNATNLGSGTVPVARLGSSGTASATTYLRGDNSWQTPSEAAHAFNAYRTSDWSVDYPGAVVNWTAEEFDSGNEFNLTNDRFTPTQAGYYLFHIQLSIDGCADGDWAEVVITKNGSNWFEAEEEMGPADGRILSGQYVLYMNGTTDYAQAFASNACVAAVGEQGESFFMGFRVGG